MKKGWLEAVRPYVRPDDFFVNIGANDGVSNDPVLPFLEQYRWRGIAVEPVPYVFDRLRRNLAGFEGIVFERAAVAATPGPRAFDHFPEPVARRLFWAGQLGTLRRGHLRQTVDRLRLLRQAGVPDDLESQIVTTTVPCLTFEELMAKHAVERVDFLNIDAEDLDFEIFRSVDLGRWRPRVLCIESAGMPSAQQGEVLLRLAEHGYVFLMRLDAFTEIFVRPEPASPGEAARPALPPSAPAPDRALEGRPVREVDGVRFVATPDDATYRCLSAAEAHFWQTTRVDLEAVDASLPEGLRHLLNQGLTGRPATSWLQDLADRGPFGVSALLGSTGGYCEVAWLGSGASRQLDVFDLSPGVLARARERAAQAGLGERLRTAQQDLNCQALPEGRYDLVFTANCLNHLCELDWALQSIRGALRPDGLFAVYEWVGEARMQFAPERSDAMTEVLRAIPADFKWLQQQRLERPLPEQLSAFQAVSAPDVLPGLSRHFDVLHCGTAGVAFPALLEADLAALAGAAPPEVLEGVMRAARRAEQGPLPGCLAYAVLRPRA